MRTKIKTSDISELSKFVISKSSEIDSVYKDMCTTVESISDIWVGDDSKTFVENALNSIKREKRENKKLQSFGEKLGVVSKECKDMENSWLENMKMENMSNE